MSEFPSHPPPYNQPEPAPRDIDPRTRRVLPWVLAAAVLLALAGAGGLVSAYIVASLRAAPPPDAALLPTQTPTVAPTASPEMPPEASPDGGGQATPTPTAPATPTPEPTPTPAPFAYVVQRGDSLFRIGQRFGVDPQAIIDLNELRNPDRIFPGQQLLIPVAEASPAPSP